MSPNSSRPPILTLATPQDSTEQSLQSKCDALTPGNLSPNFEQFMSFLKDDDADNARDDDNAVEPSADNVVETTGKGNLKEGDTSATTSAEPEPPLEVVSHDVAVVDEHLTGISGSPPSPPSAVPSNNQVDVVRNYNVQQYNYGSRHALVTEDFTTVHDSKTNTGKRCYRLNLERPFDIHCEQSPLEYGDYMAPWTKEVQPPTVGPTEYVPPRHLGGEEGVWRELMRWSHGSSLHSEEMATNAQKGKNGSANETDESGLASNFAAGIGGSGWRKLKPQEFLTVKKLGECNQEGELTFQTYDLSHAVLNEAGLAAHNATEMRDTSSLLEGSVQPVPPLSVHTIFSMDSNTSEEERLNRNGPEETADATARLFRRSEISLREAAEIEEEARLLKMRQEAEKKRLEKERQKLEKGSSKRGNLKLGKSFKKIVRRMSSTGGSEKVASSRNNSHRSVAARKANEALVTRCSVQASQIDKARGMVDGYDDGNGGLILTPGDGQTAGKAEEVAPKKLNISLLVVGEYDVLNDLVNNGAKRLSDSKDSSDLDLLLQNKPCPPPDRWVRSTGWGKCNPSSNYARNPPEDFDWEKYDDKLWLKTDDPKKAEAILDSSGLYTRRNYATKPSLKEEVVEDSLSQSQRVRRSRRNKTLGVAKAVAGVPATGKQSSTLEDEDTLSQSQRVRRSRRRAPAKT